MTNARIIGIVVGFLVGLVIAVFIVGLTNKNKDGKFGKFEYDERQERLGGKSFKFAFLVTCGYTVLLTGLSIFNVSIPAVEPLIYFSILFVGVLAMSSFSIWNDSYWGLNTDRKQFIIIMTFVTLINFIVPIRFIIDGSFIKDGKIGLSGLNLLCGILFLAIFVQDAIKRAIDKKEAD